MVTSFLKNLSFPHVLNEQKGNKNEKKMRNKFIKIRVSKLEQRIITKKANQLGVSKSELIRAALLNYKVKSRLTQEELEIFKMLTNYSLNFTRISNLVREKDFDSFKKLSMQTAKEIREIIKKLFI